MYSCIAILLSVRINDDDDDDLSRLGLIDYRLIECVIDYLIDYQLIEYVKRWRTQEDNPTMAAIENANRYIQGL